MKNKLKRRISDVHRAFSAHPTFWDGWMGREGRIINLRPPIYVRYPLFVAGGLIGLFLVFFMVQQSLTKGEVADFSPVNCLGTWANPNHAAGDPETLRGEEFSEANSALFASSSQQIYCGGFLPVATGTRGIIKNVGLTLAWQVVSNAGALQESSSVGTGVSTPTGTILGVSTSSEVSVPSASAADSGASASSDQRNPTTSPAVSAPAPLSTTPSSSLPDVSPSPDSPPAGGSPPAFAPAFTPPPETSSTSFLGGGYFATLQSIFFTSAFADNISPNQGGGTSTNLTGTIATDTTAPAANDTSTIYSADKAGDLGTTTMVVAPPISASLGPISATSTNMIPPPENASTSYSAPPPPPPDKNFVSISYSTDGESWVELEKVNVANWPNLTITLPITSWDDLAKLQILVKGIPTTENPVPRIFLDGMLLEVHYDVAADTTLEDHMLQNQSTTAQGEVSAGGIPDLGGPNPFPGLTQVRADGTSSIIVQKNDWSGNESPTLEVQVSGITGALRAGASTPSSTAVALANNSSSLLVLPAVLGASSSTVSIAPHPPKSVASSGTPTAGAASRGTLHIVLKADNTAGGTASPSDFTVQVIAGNPAPTSTFPGNPAGTVITIDANAPYGVNVSTIPNYEAGRSGSCVDSGGLVSGSSATCTIVEAYTPPATTAPVSTSTDASSSPPQDSGIPTSSVPVSSSSSGSAPDTVAATSTPTSSNSSSTP